MPGKLPADSHIDMRILYGSMKRAEVVRLHAQRNKGLEAVQRKINQLREGHCTEIEVSIRPFSGFVLGDQVLDHRHVLGLLPKILPTSLQAF